VVIVRAIYGKLTLFYFRLPSLKNICTFNKLLYGQTMEAFKPNVANLQNVARHFTKTAFKSKIGKI
jgi:hypothetical protein